MRSVGVHLASMKVPRKERMCHFQKEFNLTRIAAQRHFNKRFKAERLLSPPQRVIFKVDQEKTISKKVAEKRSINRIIRAAKKMKSSQEDTNRAIAALIRFGLLKSGGKYEQFRKTHKYFSENKCTYGISCAQYPTERKVQDLAHAIYNHPTLLTDSPDWVLKYRKGKLKILDDTSLALPNEQVTVSQINPDGYQTEEDVSNAIISILTAVGLDARYIKVRKKDHSTSKRQIAAYVYFTSAYEARCALEPLKDIGRVSIGQTIVTARVVASRVNHQVQTLLCEADGYLSEEHPREHLEQWSTGILKGFQLFLQEWIDKDGRVTFIKLKIVDPSYTVFKGGESRVIYLLEYVGDENECRRFYPTLVDQFAQCNQTTFHLNNGLPIHVVLRLSSGDHKALWNKTGRSGGHDHRDLFCNFASSRMFHLIAYQGQPDFHYKRHVDTWKQINVSMMRWKQEQLHDQIIMTKAMEHQQLSTLYRAYGRVERIPALTNGEVHEQSSVYTDLLITPLILHNQSYCCLITLELGLKHIISPESHKLKQLRGRYQGLVDGFGTTKCATSGTGIRNLINDCLPLAADTLPTFHKYAPIWYLMDTICYHMSIKGIDSEGRHHALYDFERLTFHSSTFLWWALMGDLSKQTGGRKDLKTRTKNHLEDKIYAYELVNACPEWEERTEIPLSLIDEAIFEGSFSFRDEMINTLRSKVNIERERQIVFFKRTLNHIAPSRRSRSIMSGLPQHQRVNILIRNCWKKKAKWSFNIRYGFLPRLARYSFRDRVTLSPSADIYLHLKGPIDPFYTLDTLPDIIICPCGQCTEDNAPTPAECHRPLYKWILWQKLKRFWLRAQLYRDYPRRLKEGHLRRAHAHLSVLRSYSTEESKATVPPKPMELKAAHDGYMIFYSKYPDDLPIFVLTPALSTIIEVAIKKAQRTFSIWDGNVSELPDDLDTMHLDRSWTVAKVKGILRYFKLHGNHPKDCTRMNGTRDTLLLRAIPLLTQYRTLTQVH